MAFTNAELSICTNTDLVSFITSLGFSIKQTGHTHMVVEMDSLRIFNRVSYYRYSSGTGGNAINFLTNELHYDFINAVRTLLDFNGYRKMDRTVDVQKHSKIILPTVKRTPPKPFVLPAKADNEKKLFHYLQNVRAIPEDIIRTLLKKGLIYLSTPHNNIVFCSKDAQGVIRHAHQRGTLIDKPFKGDVTGSEKKYGFNLVVPGSSVLKIFEGQMDVLSDVALYPKHPHHRLSLGSTADTALAQFLSDHKEVDTLLFNLDNDTPGSDATNKWMAAYEAKGYLVIDTREHKEYKDLNEYLMAEHPQQSNKKSPSKCR